MRSRLGGGVQLGVRRETATKSSGHQTEVGEAEVNAIRPEVSGGP